MDVPLDQLEVELFRTLGHPVRIRVPELLSADLTASAASAPAAA
ncbi:hypothetical protein GCM10020218_059100 [Dactylosporangium vinaceum]|uniref:Uncharacterized protein n=1 Tax=Dactylosporangium vinaceum TaxID=53362 RepID=A0ABV5MIP9_9ACTN|nr:hypothetical protein [Dactylosporangium vinaceum]